MSVTILNNDCRVAMHGMPEASVDSIVTDPPYGLSFMGKEWDHGVPGVEFWTEALRVAKPGAHLLAFGGTRTYHRLACAIEDAGWEIRDCVMWVYGSGFPKSLDVSKAIDKAAGVRGHDSVGFNVAGKTSGLGTIQRPELRSDHPEYTKPSGVTDAAKQWQGWGTALKPAWEPIIVARKPLVGTVAANVQAFGTGAINVDGCRVEGVPPSVPQPKLGAAKRTYGHGTGEGRSGEMSIASGRWPANLIHDGSEEVVGLFPQTISSASMRGLSGRHDAGDQSNQRIKPYTNSLRGHNDSGSAARFFYCAKASKRDRELGLSTDAPLIAAAEMVEREDGSDGMNSPRAGAGRTTGSRNAHPTVKPTALMRYLCKLVTPPGGTALDPFCGSGSTGVAARLEGFTFIGIDAEAQWADVARQRCEGVGRG